MVNSGSFETTTESETKSDYTQLESNATTKATSPRHILEACSQEETNYAATTAEMVSEEKSPPQETANSPPETHPTAILQPSETKTSLQCSVPLYKVKDILKSEENSKKPEPKSEENQKSPKRLLCLFCDRTFTSLNLKQKHMDRCHSGGISRRFSSRTPGVSQSATACWYCSKLNHTDHSLNQLLEHLVNDHSNRYFACLACEERFTSLAKCKEHNKIIHNIVDEKITDKILEVVEVKEETIDDNKDNSSPENTSRSSSRRRSAIKSPKLESEDSKSDILDYEDSIQTNVINNKDLVSANKSSKKISVKSTKNGVKNNVRTTRSQVKLLSKNKKRQKTIKTESDTEKTNTIKSAYNSTSVFSLVNLFTYKYEKIYDHASDSIKDANSGKFDAVFDKDFYIKTVTNIKENLANHLDGKLNRNVQSESRISNFEQISPESSSITTENHLDDSTPVMAIPGMSTYENFDIQIEYASKATKKSGKKVKNLTYNFSKRKYNTTRKDKTGSDLTNLDMWTQLRIKQRQRLALSEPQSLLLSQQNARAQREELNNILDKRGPFEDLRTEALEDSIQSKNTDDKLSSFRDVNIILEEILTDVFKSVEKINESSEPLLELTTENEKDLDLEIPNYLNLQKSPNKDEVKIDVTDKPTMICIAQDEDNQNVELTGEWARSRIYICATCALKLPNLKALEEHKNISHPNIWCTHYEFVGRQSEYYRHLGIPGLGKVGVVEKLPMNKLWVRSDARTCTKCAKQCHNLGELHRHILECGGDWQWMLARKKCKYRPYGAKRRRQRGYKRSCNPDLPRARRGPRPKTAQVGPRSKPSDAETIQRMLANLPAKRNRKMISMRDGIQGPRKQYIKRSNLRSTSTLHTENAMKVNSQSQRILRTRISQVTNRALKNSLKRKINARVLRSRSAIIKQHEEQESSDEEIKDDEKRISPRRVVATRTFNRVLGSKILDNNSTLASRRQLVKSVIQNTLRTRLRSRLEEKHTQEIEKKRKLRNRNEKSEELNKELKTNDSKNNTDLIKEVKVQKGQDKNKKSVGKRLLSLVTSKSKKLKTDAKKEEVKDKKENPKTEHVQTDKPRKKLKVETPKSTSKLKKASPKPPKVEIIYEFNNLSAVIDSVASNSMDQYDPRGLSSYIRKKASNLVKNVKNINKNAEKSNKIHNKIPEKSVASKLIRTLSMRNKKRKIENRKVIEKTDETLEVNVCDDDSKNDNQKNLDEAPTSKNEENVDNVSSVSSSEKEIQVCEDSNEITSRSPDESSSNISDDLETMPTLEKIDIMPRKLPLEDSIPILSPIYTSVSLKTTPDSNTAKKIDFSDLDTSKSGYEEQKVVEESNEAPNNDLTIENNPKDMNLEDNNDTLIQTMENNKQISALTKFKNKFKRSGKGLNDCIAMLKNKLEKISEPSIVDKSNLFILNASENRGPVICENNKLIENNTVDKNIQSVKNSELGVLSKKNNKLEMKTVLEIPNLNKKLVLPPVEEQITNPPEFIPDLKINPLSTVLDVAMKNCLLECVKTKCEELKNGATSYKTNKPKSLRKIGSVRKRKTCKSETVNNKDLPRSLNDAFIANNTAKIYDSDEDIPLSTLCNSPILKGKITSVNKRKSKENVKHVILNKIEAKINLQDKKEKTVNDNSEDIKVRSAKAEIENNKTTTQNFPQILSLYSDNLLKHNNSFVTSNVSPSNENISVITKQRSLSEISAYIPSENSSRESSELTVIDIKPSSEMMPNNIKIPAVISPKMSSEITSKESQVSSGISLESSPKISSDISPKISLEVQSENCQISSEYSRSVSESTIENNSIKKPEISLKELLIQNALNKPKQPEFSQMFYETTSELLQNENIKGLIENLQNTNFNMEDEPLELIDKTLEKSNINTDLSILTTEIDIISTPEKVNKLNNRVKKGKKHYNTDESPKTTEKILTVIENKETLNTIPLLENKLLNKNQIDDFEVSKFRKHGCNNNINKDLCESETKNSKIVEPVTIKLNLSLNTSKNDESEEKDDNSLKTELTMEKSDEFEKENVVKSKRRSKKIKDNEPSFISDENVANSQENFLKSPETSTNEYLICRKLSLSENIQNESENSTKQKRNRGKSKKRNSLSSTEDNLDMSEKQKTETKVSPPQNEIKKGRGRKKSIKLHDNILQTEENVIENEIRASFNLGTNAKLDIENFYSAPKNEIKNGRGRKESIKSQEKNLQFEENNIQSVIGTSIDSSDYQKSEIYISDSSPQNETKRGRGRRMNIKSQENTLHFDENEIKASSDLGENQNSETENSDSLPLNETKRGRGRKSIKSLENTLRGEENLKENVIEAIFDLGDNQNSETDNFNLPPSNEIKRGRGRKKSIKSLENTFNHEESPIEKEIAIFDLGDNQNSDAAISDFPPLNEIRKGRGRQKSIKSLENSLQREENLNENEIGAVIDIGDNQNSDAAISDSPPLNEIKRGRRRSKSIKSVENTLKEYETIPIVDSNEKQNSETKLFDSPQIEIKTGRGRKISIKSQVNTLTLPENLNQNEILSIFDSSDNQNIDIFDSPGQNQIEQKKAIKSKENTPQIEESKLKSQETESIHNIEKINKRSEISEGNTVKMRKKPGRKPKAKSSIENNISSNTIFNENVKKPGDKSDILCVNINETIALNQLENHSNENIIVDKTIPNNLTFIVDNQLKNIKIRRIKKTKGRKPFKTIRKTDDLTSTENEDSSFENSDFAGNSTDEMTKNEFKKPRRQVRRKPYIFESKTSDSETISTENDDESSFENITYNSIDQSIENVISGNNSSKKLTDEVDLTSEPLLNDLFSMETKENSSEKLDLANSIEKVIENMVTSKNGSYKTQLETSSDNFDHLKSVVNEINMSKKRKGKTQTICKSLINDIMDIETEDNIEQFEKVLPSNHSIENVVHDVEMLNLTSLQICEIPVEDNILKFSKKRGRKSQNISDPEITNENNQIILESSLESIENKTFDTEKNNVIGILTSKNQGCKKENNLKPKSFNDEQTTSDSFDVIQGTKNIAQTQSDEIVENSVNVIKMRKKRGRKKQNNSEIHTDTVQTLDISINSEENGNKMSKRVCNKQKKLELGEYKHNCLENASITLEKLNIQENIVEKTHKDIDSEIQPKKRGRKKENNLEPEITDELPPISINFETESIFEDSIDDTIENVVKMSEKWGRKKENNLEPEITDELPPISINFETASIFEDSIDDTIENVVKMSEKWERKNQNIFETEIDTSANLILAQNMESFENTDDFKRPNGENVKVKTPKKRGRKKQNFLESKVPDVDTEINISNSLESDQSVESTENEIKTIIENIQNNIKAIKTRAHKKHQPKTNDMTLIENNKILLENSNIEEKIFNLDLSRDNNMEDVNEIENQTYESSQQNVMTIAENKKISLGSPTILEKANILEESLETPEMVMVNVVKSHKKGRKKQLKPPDSLTFKENNKSSFDSSSVSEKSNILEESIETKEITMGDVEKSPKKGRKKLQKSTNNLTLIENNEMSFENSSVSEKSSILEESLEAREIIMEDTTWSTKSGRKKQHKSLDNLTLIENNDTALESSNLLENPNILNESIETTDNSIKSQKRGRKKVHKPSNFPLIKTSFDIPNLQTENSIEATENSNELKVQKRVRKPKNCNTNEMAETNLEKVKKRGQKHKVSEIITPVKIIISNIAQSTPKSIVSEDITLDMDNSQDDNSEIRTADEEIDKELSILNSNDLAKNNISSSVSKKGKKGKRGAKTKKEVNSIEIEQNKHDSETKTIDESKILDLETKLIETEKIYISEEIPKTPTIVLGASDSEDEIPLSFLAKTTNDDEILDSISENLETPAILIKNNIPDEEALNDIAELINEKDISEKIDDTIFDISYDMIEKSEKILDETVNNFNIDDSRNLQEEIRNLAIIYINTSLEEVLSEQNKETDFPEIPKTPTVSIENDKETETPKNETSSDFITTPDLNNTSTFLKLQKKLNCKIKKPKKGRKKLNLKLAPKVIKKDENPNDVFCEICNKSFTRLENLVKHKRTLTHISKLSEIEAQINIQKSDMEKIDDLPLVEELIHKEPIVSNEINLIDDISTDLEKSSETFPVIINNKTTNLKLVDIINDVLDKPTTDINLSESILSKNIPTSEIKSKRYKSMAERKSFDSDSYLNIPQKSDILPENEYNTQTNSQILDKQISLLENIIEKRTPDLNYIEDSISYSSNHFEQTIPVKNISEKETYTEFPIKSQIKFSHTNDIISNFIKPGGDFTNYENPKQQKSQILDENSQDKNNATRKILNRDEELFLECCSLLKSGSEISKSKKQSKQSYSNVEAWVEQKHPTNFIQRDLSWLAQGSRVETPIGEPYVNNDWSNSNSAVSSEWLAQKAASPDQPVENNTLSKKENNNSDNFSNIQFEDISLESSLTRNTAVSTEKFKDNVPLDFHNFHFVKPNDPELVENSVDEILLDEKENDMVENDEKRDENESNETAADVDENLKRHVVSAFGGLMAKALKCRLKAVVRRSHKAKEKRTFISTLQPVITDYAIPVKKNKINPDITTKTSKNSNDGPKKIATKGALKVFEGLKVSIPTQDLNLKEVLKSTNIESKYDKEKSQKSKKNVFQNFGNKLGLKETKKKTSKKLKNLKQSQDIYDFEESEDSSSLFKNKSLTIFRNICTENKQSFSEISTTELDKNEPQISGLVDSESETDRYYDSVSFEENSLSNESLEESEELKLKEASEKSLSKKDSQKKCMIMGRIFKNASKPKLEDKIPEIRDISSEENSKIVETCIDSYSSLENIETTLESCSALPTNNLTIINSQNKMSQGEMDFLFDKLLNENQKTTLPQPEIPKTNPEYTDDSQKSKEKPKTKPKKRQRHNSDNSASTDEFVLSGKPSKSSKKHRKHPRKPNLKKQNGGINLEQEMKECIGVAGRKSQRKCTSGKQNVLAEFWSSDESIDYAELIRQSECNNRKDVENEINVACESSMVKANEIPTDLYEFIPDFDEVEEPIVPLEKLEKTKKIGRFQIKKSETKEDGDIERKKRNKKKRNSQSEGSDSISNTRRKRNAAETLYYWSSTSDDELQDLIEVKPIREDTEEERPMQHGWIVGDSPKKLVTMLAQAKGHKKIDCESVKEQNKKIRTTL